MDKKEEIMELFRKSHFRIMTRWNFITTFLYDYFTTNKYNNYGFFESLKGRFDLMKRYYFVIYLEDGVIVSAYDKKMGYLTYDMKTIDDLLKDGPPPLPRSEADSLFYREHP